MVVHAVDNGDVVIPSEVKGAIVSIQGYSTVRSMIVHGVMRDGEGVTLVYSCCFHALF